MGLKVGTRVNLAGIKKKFSPRSMTLGLIAMANQALADMNQFIPARGFTLRGTGNVINDGRQIEWRMPYAKAQFHGSRPWRRGMPVNVFMRKYTTPGTGPRWDLKAKARHGQSWARAFKRGSLL